MERRVQSSTRTRRERRVEGEGHRMEIVIPRELARLVIGSGGSTVKAIERSTGTKVYVHLPDVDDGRTYVAVTGNVKQAQEALEEVRAVVAEVNANCAQQLRGKFVFEEGANLGRPNITENDFGQSGRATFNKERQAEAEWCCEDITACMTISAKKALFKCLMGKDGSNLKKLRRLCRAGVEVQDHREAKENQHVYINGDIDDVIFAAENVTESLRWYDPGRDTQRHGQKNDEASDVDLKVIRAEVVFKIKDSVSGYLIGKGGQKINRIKSETEVDTINVDKFPDKDGFNGVRIIGKVDPVLEAVREIQNVLQGCKVLPPEYNPVQQSPQLPPERHEQSSVHAAAAPEIGPPPGFEPISGQRPREDITAEDLVQQLKDLAEQMKQHLPQRQTAAADSAPRLEKQRERHPYNTVYYNGVYEMDSLWRQVNAPTGSWRRQDNAPSSGRPDNASSISTSPRHSQATTPRAGSESSPWYLDFL